MSCSMRTSGPQARTSSIRSRLAYPCDVRVGGAGVQPDLRHDIRARYASRKQTLDQ
jgi:hypothetical protein